MNRRVTLGLLAVASLSWGGSGWCQVAESAPSAEVREFQGIRYLTGGVGEAERNRILAERQNFNLKLMFAEKSRAYLADVAVTITEAGGRTVLDITSDGPLVLAKLPPGEYEVAATANGKQHTRNVTIQEQGQASLDFYW